MFFMLILLPVPRMAIETFMAPSWIDDCVSREGDMLLCSNFGLLGSRIVEVLSLPLGRKLS